MSVCLSVCLSIYLSVCLSIYLFIYLIHLSFCISLSAKLLKTYIIYVYIYIYSTMEFLLMGDPQVTMVVSLLTCKTVIYDLDDANKNHWLQTPPQVFGLLSRSSLYDRFQWIFTRDPSGTIWAKNCLPRANISGWWLNPTPLKNMKVNWDDEIPNWMGK